MNFEDILFGIMVAISGALGVVFCILLFVYVPVELQTEQDCLRQGYPKSTVTVGLERYCLSYDGALHPVVVPVK